LKFLRLSAVLYLLLSAAAFAQTPATTGETVFVVPFENQSKAPGIEWISDSFPELLQERLNLSTLFVLPREDRIRAYDRVGIPLEVHRARRFTGSPSNSMRTMWCSVYTASTAGRSLPRRNCWTCAAST